MPSYREVSLMWKKPLISLKERVQPSINAKEAWEVLFENLDALSNNLPF